MVDSQAKAITTLVDVQTSNVFGRGGSLQSARGDSAVNAAAPESCITNNTNTQTNSTPTLDVITFLLKKSAMRAGRRKKRDKELVKMRYISALNRN
jgi:hypothetical protein